MWAVIRELVTQGATLLLTTQYLDEADELADNIVVIDHGQVIASGTSEALKDRVGGDVVEFSVTDRSKLGAAVEAVAALGQAQPLPTSGRSSPGARGRPGFGHTGRGGCCAGRRWHLYYRARGPTAVAGRRVLVTYGPRGRG